MWGGGQGSHTHTHTHRPEAWPAVSGEAGLKEELDDWMNEATRWYVYVCEWVCVCVCVCVWGGVIS